MAVGVGTVILNCSQLFSFASVLDSLEILNLLLVVRSVPCQLNLYLAMRE